MIKFQQLQTDHNLAQIIHSAFDIKLQVDGGWGYDSKNALIITDTSMPLLQLEHTLASMRTHIEMNMTLPKEERYGAININELQREQRRIDAKIYDIVTYQITAILEKTYEQLIDAYKMGQDSPSFDLEDHFRQRKNATLIREEAFWFDITACHVENTEK